MTYDLAPAHADTDAPRPSGIAYAKTSEPHEGCPGNGFLAWDIDAFTGASMACCTGCAYRRLAGRFVTPESMVAALAPEPARKPMGMNAPRVVKKKAKAPASKPRHCANPTCGRPLNPGQASCCSAACGLQLARVSRLTRLAEIRAGTRPAPPPQTRPRTCAECNQPFEQDVRARLDHVPRCPSCRAAPVIPAVPCVDCSTPVPRSRHARRDSVPRCAPCQAAADQKRLDACRADQRAGAGQVAA